MDKRNLKIPDLESRIKIFKDTISIEPSNLRKTRKDNANHVRTAKFTFWSWLPRSLIYQFQRIANVYFLFVTILTFFRFSPKRSEPKILSLGVVILFTALKDLFEDSRRRQEDKKENRKPIRVYSTEMQSFVKIECQKMVIGDICLVMKNEIVPADLLFIQSSEENNTGYVSTDMLDGETYLREKNVLHCIPVTESPEEMSQEIFAKGIQIDLPPSVKNFNDISGQVHYEEKTSEIARRHILYQGSRVKDVEHMLGIACYVGKRTKINLNMTNRDMRRSNLQVRLNQMVASLVSILFIICLYIAVRHELYPRSEGEEPIHSFFEIFASYIIAMYNIIPISLYVSFEFVKLVSAYKINNSKSLSRILPNGEKRQAIKAKTGDNVDDLGQITHLFLDKTGTMTKNEMKLRSFIFGKSGNAHLITQTTDRKEYFSRNDTKYLFYSILLCNSLKIKKNEIWGCSPDEKALVQGLREWYEIELRTRERKLVKGEIEEDKTVLFRGVEETHTVYMTFDYSHERKRMSVLTKIGDEILLLIKGADDVMAERMKGGIPHHVEELMGKECAKGSRVLVFAMKKIPEDAFKKWIKKYRASDYEKKEELTNELETGLNFLGVTCVDDVLQFNIEKTLQKLRKAGIRLWVLTGDKVDTALAVARASGLLGSVTELHFLIKDEDFLDIHAWNEEDWKKSECHGLVMNGEILQRILLDKETSKSFTKLAAKMTSIICCRLAPAQKREIIRIVKDNTLNAITAAVGDGGNDVPMINEAHVGIGLHGNEGNQASHMADYAIDEFENLEYLILHYGRLAAIRLPLLLLYFIYKNIVVVVPELVFAHEINFTGAEIAFPDILSTFYNAVFTALPILFVATCELYLPKHISVRYPKLYCLAASHRVFNFRRIFTWCIVAVSHGLLTWYIPYFILVPPYNEELFYDKYSLASLVSYTCIILTVTYKICLSSRASHGVTYFSVFATLFAYIVAVALLDELKLQPELENTFTGEGFFSLPAGLLVILLPIAVQLPEVGYIMYRTRIKPSRVEQIRYLETERTREKL